MTYAVPATKTIISTRALTSTTIYTTTSSKTRVIHELLQKTSTSTTLIYIATVTEINAINGTSTKVSTRTLRHIAHDIAENQLLTRTQTISRTARVQSLILLTETAYTGLDRTFAQPTYTQMNVVTSKSLLLSIRISSPVTNIRQTELLYSTIDRIFTYTVPLVNEAVEQVILLTSSLIQQAVTEWITQVNLFSAIAVITAVDIEITSRTEPTIELAIFSLLLPTQILPDVTISLTHTSTNLQFLTSTRTYTTRTLSIAIAQTTVPNVILSTASAIVATILFPFTSTKSFILSTTSPSTSTSFSIAIFRSTLPQIGLSSLLTSILGVTSILGGLLG